MSAEATCGVRVWTSNWVPSIWSVREFWPGDNYALALAYFNTGLPEAGWEVLRGNMLHDQFNFVSPGVLGASNGGVDFNDIVHPFARAIIEGVFGYRPDYPVGRVTCAPQFPVAWKNASGSTRHFSLDFVDSGDVSTTTLTLEQPAVITLSTPIRARAIGAVLLDGVAVPPSRLAVSAGFGQTIVTVTTPAAQSSATVSIRYSSPAAEYQPAVSLNAEVGSVLKLPLPAGWSFTSNTSGGTPPAYPSDPTGLFVPGSRKMTASTFEGVVANGTDGHHVVFAYLKPTAKAGGSITAEQCLMFKVNVSDPVQAHARRRRETASVSAVTAAPGNWKPVDLGPVATTATSFWTIFCPFLPIVCPFLSTYARAHERCVVCSS